MLKNKLGKGLLALALVIGTTAIGASVVSADTTKDTKLKSMSSIVTAISQKFGLNETEVQAVFDAEMQKHRTEMQAKFAENFATKLATAVSNGKITQAQSDLIKAKQVEIKAKMDALHTEGVQPTDAQKLEMKTMMDSVKSWADTNNIPMEFLKMGGHKKGPRHN